MICCCRVFQPTKNAFVDTLRSVVADVKWFLLFLVLTMWGFAGAFYILFREDQKDFQASKLTQNVFPLQDKHLSSWEAAGTVSCITCACVCNPTQSF